MLSVQSVLISEGQPDPVVIVFLFLLNPDSGYLLNMTSQGWLDSSKIDHVVWTHQLVIIVPKVLKYTDTAGMYITGGGNNNPSPPDVDSEDILLSSIMAQELGIITATLFQVPNAPIVFTSDPEVRCDVDVMGRYLCRSCGSLPLLFCSFLLNIAQGPY